MLCFFLPSGRKGDVDAERERPKHAGTTRQVCWKANREREREEFRARSDGALAYKQAEQITRERFTPGQRTVRKYEHVSDGGGGGGDEDTAKNKKHGEGKESAGRGWPRRDQIYGTGAREVDGSTKKARDQAKQEGEIFE